MFQGFLNVFSIFLFAKDIFILFFFSNPSSFPCGMKLDLRGEGFIFASDFYGRVGGNRFFAC